MAQIYATFGDVPGLTVAVIVRDKADGSLDFSGNMTNLAGGLYFFQFTEVPGKEYVWQAFAEGWTVASGELIEASSGGGGGLTPEQEIQLAATVKKGDTLLNLGDIILPL